ncbi:AAA family ATPase [Eudoraea adriatica]|uniref:AAA family ATPase n=1 Tax=Eudoraea adriatica TaxID=446681 RepID=UPI000360EE6D|nr:AAA family ATPase [Eudoraea adriatica]
MKLKQARRQDVKLRIGISGASGFGKTYSALKLAHGITGDYSKIAIIDSEHGSASLYAELGPFNILVLDGPYPPEKYIQAISLCEKQGMEVIIIDSISHEWTGEGGCLQIHEQLGGRFQDWAKVTPRHQAFIEKLLHANAHIITTTRRKVDYSLDTTSKGRTKVVKHGTKELTREGFEYELTLNLELINENHLAKASKDRTGLFMNKPEFVINAATGKKLKAWCSQDEKRAKIQELINNAQSKEELRHIYMEHPDYQQQIKADLRSRLDQLEKEDIAAPVETKTQ